MTTAARPTFDPARGKGSQAPTRIYSSRDLASHTKLKFRQTGQTSQNELNNLDLKAQLLKAERDHYEKANRATKLAVGLSNSFKDTDDDDDDDNSNKTSGAAAESSTTETPLERKRRLLKEAERLDKDDDDSDDSDKNSSDSDSDSDDDDDDDDEDDTAELLRELEKIKRERAEEKERQERLQLEEEEREREAQAATGNPLLEMSGNTQKDFSVKRRWDDDVIFKNQAKGIDEKPKKRFVNDTLRSDFHRKFMNKYVQ